MKSIAIIQASSRSNGDTHRVVNYLAKNIDVDIIDLRTKSIGHYDYDNKNEGDDFLKLMTNIASKYDTIIFATPVYWYTMSGILKVFFDRISDLLRIHKTTGRLLRGKNMAMVSVSNSDDLKDGFSMPFIESANYLGMHYLGDTHAYVENKEINTTVKQRLDLLIEILKK